MLLLGLGIGFGVCFGNLLEVLRWFLVEIAFALFAAELNFLAVMNKGVRFAVVAAQFLVGDDANLERLRLHFLGSFVNLGYELGRRLVEVSFAVFAAEFYFAAIMNEHVRVAMAAQFLAGDNAGIQGIRFSFLLSFFVRSQHCQWSGKAGNEDGTDSYVFEFFHKSLG